MNSAAYGIELSNRNYIRIPLIAERNREILLNHYERNIPLISWYLDKVEYDGDIQVDFVYPDPKIFCIQNNGGLNVRKDVLQAVGIVEYIEKH